MSAICIARAHHERERRLIARTQCPSHGPSAALRECIASQGFVAKPQNLPDGTQDLLNWEVIIPGKTGTIWEGACIPMSMAFTEDYPDKPPVCKFKLVGSSQKPLSSIRTCTRVARSA